MDSLELLNSQFDETKVPNKKDGAFISTVEGAVDLEAGAEEAWSKAEKLVSMVQSTGLDTFLPPELKSQLGKVVEVVVPLLVSTTISVSATVPFAGPVTALLVQFYSAVSSAINNIKSARDLTETMNQVTTWLKSAIYPMRVLKETADPKAYGIYLSNIEKYMKNLALHIRSASELFAQFDEIKSDSCFRAVGGFARAVVFHTQDEAKIASIAVDVSKAQNSLTQYFSTFSLALHADKMSATRQLPQIEKIREALMSPFIYFEDEISAHMSGFLKGSREWLHSDVRLWLESQERMLWVCADAGMGKSAFAASLVCNLKASRKLLAVFFCKFGERRRSDASNILKSLAYQIAENLPTCRDGIEAACKDAQKDDVSLSELINELIIDPLRNNQGDNAAGSYVIVIDALDEIGVRGSPERLTFLDLLCRCASQLPSYVKLLVTSRPEKDIIDKFEKFKPTIIDPDNPNHEVDLRKYIRWCLRGRLENPDEEDAAVQLMFEKSERKFVYMSMVSKDIFASESKWTLKSLGNLAHGMDESYFRYFKKIKDTNSDYESKLKPMLILLTTMQEPLLVSQLACFLGFQESEVRRLASALESMFPLRGAAGEERFQFFHKSIVDWLVTSENTCRTEVLNYDISEQIPVELFLEIWLKCAFPTSNDDEIAELIRTLLQCGLRNVNSLFRMDAEGWRDLPLPPFVKSDMRWHIELVKNRSVILQYPPKDYNFHIDPVPAHGMFADILLKMIDGYQDEQSIEWTLPEAPEVRAYLLGHLLDHLDLAERNHETLAILIRLPWLLLSMKERPKRLLDVIDDMKKRVRRDDDADSKDLTLLLGALRLTMGYIQQVANEYEVKDNHLVLQLMGRLTLLVSSGEERPLLTLYRHCQQWWRTHEPFYPMNYMLDSPGTCIESMIRVEDVNTAIVSMVHLNGSVVAVGLLNGWVRLLDIDTTECLRTLKGHTKRVNMIDIWKEELIVTCSDDFDLRVWNIEEGRCVWHIKHSNYLYGTGFINSRMVVSGCYDNMVRAWTLNEDGTSSQRVIGSHRAEISSLCVLKDGRIASSCYEKEIKVWDLTLPEPVVTFTDQLSTPMVIVSIDNDRFASGNETGQITIWSIKLGKLTQTLDERSESPITSIILTNQLHMYAMSGRQDTSVYYFKGDDNGQYTCAKVFPCQDAYTYSMCMLPDGRFLRSAMYTLGTWNTKKFYYTIPAAHKGAIDRIIVMPDGKIVSGAFDKSLKVWDPETQELIKTIDCHDGEVEGMDVYSNTRIATAAFDKLIRIVDIESGDVVSVGRGHTDNCFPIRVMANGQVLSGSFDSTVMLWDVTKPRATRLRTYKGHEDGVTSIRLLPGETSFASGDFVGAILIHNIDSSIPVKRMIGHTSIVLDMTIRGDRMISVTTDRVIFVWDMNTNEVIDKDTHYGDYPIEYYKHPISKVMERIYIEDKGIWVVHPNKKLLIRGAMNGTVTFFAAPEPQESYFIEEVKADEVAPPENTVANVIQDVDSDMGSDDGSL